MTKHLRSKTFGRIMGVAFCMAVLVLLVVLTAHH